MLGLIGEGTGIAAKVLKSMGKESLTCLSQLNYALFSDYERPSYPLTKQTWFFFLFVFWFLPINSCHGERRRRRRRPLASYSILRSHPPPKSGEEISKKPQAQDTTKVWLESTTTGEKG